MKGNFTLYGPTHSGKSTLAGYIYTRDKSDEEIARLDQQIKEELGTEYDPAQRIAYYVDKASDERRRDATSSSIGTSKNLHYQLVNMGDRGDFLLIDSPGSSKQWRQKYKGSFLGDIGILVYNVSAFFRLANMDRNSYLYKREREKVLWQVKLWKEYKNLDYLIIAISKMDGENSGLKGFSDKYSRILFANAITVIRSEEGLSDVPVIPIAIDVAGRAEHNVFTKSPMMEWYSGRTLIGEMEEKGRKFLKNCVPGSYTFANIVEKLHVRETGEPVFRIKVLSGSIKKGDTLRLTQVRESKHLDYKMGQARIKSLKPDQGERTDIFAQGTIGGAILSRITIDGKSVSAEDLKLSRASFLIATQMAVKEGNVLLLKSKSESEQFLDLSLHDKVNLLMFGKIISMILIAKWQEEDTFYLQVYAKNYPLVLPVCDDGRMALPNYVIEKENMDFLAVELLDAKLLGTQDWKLLQIKLDQDLPEEEVRLMLNEASIKYLNKREWILRVSAIDIEMVTARLRMLFRKKKIYEYSVRLLDETD